MTSKKVTELFIFSLMLAAYTAASTLVEEQLSALQEVSLRAVVPRYEPLSNDEPEELEKKIKNCMKRSIKPAKLEIVDSSEQRLVATISYENIQAEGDQIAILIELELRESAFLLREFSKSEGPRRFVSSWRHSEIVISTKSKAHQDILENVESATNRFAQSLIAAKLNI